MRTILVGPEYVCRVLGHTILVGPDTHRPPANLRRRRVRREHLITFYDIFVQNAFGNFEDLLKEVTYSPLMGIFLTYKDNVAYHRRKTYPDENYAREVMQLFTLGPSFALSALRYGHGQTGY